MNKMLLILACLVTLLTISCSTVFSPNYFKFINRSSHTVHLEVEGKGYSLEPGEKEGFPSTYDSINYSYTPFDKVTSKTKSGRWYDRNFNMVRGWMDITFYDQH